MEGYDNPAADVYKDVGENGQQPPKDAQNGAVQPSLSLYQRKVDSLWKLVDAAMRSPIVLAVCQLWSFAELLLCWVFVFAMFDVPFTPTAPVFVLMFFMAIKTILFLSETAFAISNDYQICHRYSQMLTVLLQGVTEPLAEIPTTVAFRSGSLCYFLQRLLSKPVVKGKLWIGLVHIFVMAFKWLLQSRHQWLTDSSQRKKTTTLALLILACLSSIWLFGFRIWYLDLTYVSERPTCYFTPLIQVIPENEKQVQLLQEMFGKDEELLFCHQPRGIGDHVSLMFKNSNWSKWEKKFDQVDLKYETLEDDVQGSVEKEKQENAARRVFKEEMKADDFEFDYYHPIDEINQFLSVVARENPTITQLFSVGNSFEGKPLQVMKLSADLGMNNTNSSAKPAFWFDCGIHAREWVTSATATFIIRELIRNHTETGAGASSLLDLMDWYIMPIMNPDGYKHTWEKDRLWRKNRNPLPGSPCEGVDLNRNWGFSFGNIGANAEPCSDVYHGSRAFSEPETRAVAAFLANSSVSFLVYINVHSYSQMWFIPFSHQKDTYSDDKEELLRVSEKALKKLKSVNGTEYQLGSAADILYAASGTAEDWAKGGAGIKFSFAVELRPTGCLHLGFLLPRDQIVPTARETFVAFSAVAEEVVAAV